MKYEKNLRKLGSIAGNIFDLMVWNALWYVRRAPSVKTVWSRIISQKIHRLK